MAHKNESKVAKNIGTDFYKKSEYAQASHQFTLAIESTEVDIDDLHVLYSNRCACYLHLNELNKALDDAQACISIKPTWPKAYNRKAACLIRLNRLQEAIIALEKATELDPSNGEIKQLLAQTRSKQSGHSGQPRFGGFSGFDGNSLLHKVKEYASNLIIQAMQWWSTISDDQKKYIAIGAAGLVIYFFFFRGPRRGHYDDYSYGHGGGGGGLSWTMWGAIMLAAYKLPPMFPDMLGPYAQPFFGMSWTTFMWLLNMLSRNGSMMGGRGYGRRRYY